MNEATPLENDAVELLLAEATDEFTSRARRGDEPSVEEYARRYPQIAGILRQLLPAVRLMHRASASPAEPLGCLGDFRLLGEIGRGGMGVVYEAEQISLRRRVALKVLPLAAALDPRQLQRFQLEAQAAAHLHHTNIVPIFSVGCERGVYYYAMQYVAGRSLAEVIAELSTRNGARGAVNEAVSAAAAVASTVDPLAAAGPEGARRQAADPPGSLPESPPGSLSGSAVRPMSSTSVDGDGRSAGAGNETREADTIQVVRADADTAWSTEGDAHFQRVAALGIQAAEALDHAHAMGVIHRDIKPANLLLDVRGTLYVADFGLARLQGDAGLTVTGGLAGTLRYMSPEQALAQHGVVDHRTDIYSLGATLYELLTLSPAFDAADRHVLLRQIAQDEPVAPRHRDKRIPIDLETIILKAMAKEPSARYAMARDLADDLRRFQQQRPILARRPTLWERGVKWSRRHRGLAAAAVGVLVLCAVGFGLSTVLVTRAYDRLAAEQAKTKAAYEAEAQQRARAEQSFQQARQIVDFITEVSEDELADKPEMQSLRRMLLAAALDYYQDFIRQSGNDPTLQAQLAASHLRVAAILDEIGSPADAQAALDRARELQEKLGHVDLKVPQLQHGFFANFRRFGMMHSGREANLLGQRSVQEDLKLSPQQAQKVEQLSQQRRALASSSGELSVAQWQTRFEDLAGREKGLLDMLNPQQAARFHQIALQQRGVEALTDPAVAQALQLSDQQIQKIRDVRDDTRRSLWAAGRNGGPGPEQFAKARETWQAMSDKMVGQLTERQREQWKSMLGPPLKGKIMPSHRGPWHSRHGGPPPGHPGPPGPEAADAAAVEAGPPPIQPPPSGAKD